MKGRPRFRRARRHVAVGLARFSRHEDTRLLILAVVVGVLSALAAVLFWDLFDLVRDLTFGTRTEAVLLDPKVISWWLFLVVPAAGGLLIGLFVHTVMPDRRPHAVADVVEAVAVRDGRMSLRTGLAAAAVSAASIGVGASVGRGAQRADVDDPDRLRIDRRLRGDDRGHGRRGHRLGDQPPFRRRLVLRLAIAPPRD